MRAILRENGIAVREMAIPNKYHVISVPFLKSIRASMLSAPNILTDNYWDSPIVMDEEFMGVKEYELTTTEYNTAFYDLIIRKERKKMSRCDCESTCRCAHLPLCEAETQAPKDKKVYKYALLGFQLDGGVPKFINSYSGMPKEKGELLILNLADEKRDSYSSFSLVAFDIDLNIVYTRPVCFDVPIRPKARLC